MSTIVNVRDVRLQATSPRMINVNVLANQQVTAASMAPASVTAANGALAPASVTAASGALANSSVETLKITSNAVTIPASVSGSNGNITVGTDVTDGGTFSITEGDQFATYTSPTAVDVDLNNQILVLGRTGFVGDESGGPQRRFAIFAGSTLIADSGWSYFAADFFNLGVLHTQTVGTSVVYTFRVKARTYPGTTHSESLAATINIMGVRR